MMRRVSTIECVALAAIACAAISGCTCSSTGDDGTSGKGGKGTGGGAMFDFDSGKLSISPDTVSVDVNPGSGTPATTEFQVVGATNDQVTWSISNPSLGTIDKNGVFTASGQGAGAGEIRATLGDVVAVARITVKIAYRQNGASAGANRDAGVGGLGGVGGEGFGGAVPDALIGTLEGTAGADAALGLLYPYDQTVFPLDVLPPLLQWSDGSKGTIDAVYIHLSAPPYYDYKGFFARPAGLASGAPFVRHPIPKDVWAAATRTAAGSTLDLTVVVAAGQKAWGPVEQHYKIALAPINGKIYYQAYNTALAHNYDGNTVSGAPMGGATLSISVGQESPRLVAGTTTTDHSGCRVCHSVSAYGDRMIVQHGDDYTQTSTYDLKNGNAESKPYQAGTVGWAGLFPDGTLGLSNNIEVANTGESGGSATLYDMTSGAAIASPGLAAFATSIGLPSFAPDGKHAAFVLFSGPSTPAVGAPNGRQLVVMDFDVGSKTFSNPKKLWESAVPEERPGWSTFLPTSQAVVFQRRFQGTTNEIFASRNGARGELWWVDLASGQAAALGQTNGVGTDGKSYLPTGGENHAQDERLSYEPSISPVASGGYAWMVFLSRRAYGNVATMDPWHSDPRDYDLTTGITTKKIWMAAIDLNPEPGKDPSHPAFYIPGQELHGVNSRPFFALQPCLSDRGTCTTGIDCCSGFCRDGLCAPPQNDCSKIDEKCASQADCCDPGAQCFGGFCAVLLH